jgi:hypothetical protein
MILRTRNFSAKPVGFLTSLSLALFVSGVPSLPSSAQMCDPSIMSCADEAPFSSTPPDMDGGSSFTPSFGSDAGVPPNPTPTYTAKDACIDQAESAFMKCTDNIGGNSLKGAAIGGVGGAVTGSVAGGVGAVPGAALGAVGGFTSTAVGTGLYCTGQYIVDRAACESK